MTIILIQKNTYQLFKTYSNCIKIWCHLVNIIDDKIDQLTKAVSSTTLEMTNVKTAVGGVEDTLTGVNKVAEDTKRDVASLTDGISGENQVSSAIEMAREGASMEKIVAVTGISKEEAEAVVRFHKPES